MSGQDAGTVARRRQWLSWRLIVLTALLTSVSLAVDGLRTVANAAPVVGGQLYATGGLVEVEVLPATARFTSELWLFSPGPARRLATNREPGRVVSIGRPARGAELIFGVRVLDTGHEFRMGPGMRNPDGVPHAAVDEERAGFAVVGFEDVFGGGDRDYDDNLFEFSGGIDDEPC